MTTSNTPRRNIRQGARPARDLPVTTYAVLGQLAAGPSSGYEVKARLEAGAAHFWHASYSQIYAELRRLTELGAGERGARPAGRAAQQARLHDHRRRAGGRCAPGWRSRGGSRTLRDESLVKLTLADPLPRGGGRRPAAAPEGGSRAPARRVRGRDRGAPRGRPAPTWCSRSARASTPSARSPAGARRRSTRWARPPR